MLIVKILNRSGQNEMLNGRPALPYKTNTGVDAGRHRLCLKRRIKFNSSYVRPFFYQSVILLFLMFIILVHKVICDCYRKAIECDMQSHHCSCPYPGPN